ncbi:hypothetical protein BBD31_01630 [Elizabethkingia anophelis]|uniref:hypothetical protein n=1 Tax=Elizabethkingia anophelis TaxID=1117645 RepID=UPI000994F1DE|nr:hypothetical protein [Elizabethkingia anophelis]AQW96675.1 hypothetical protein BBD31_01630 [Elizabethkingia anophelis]MDV3673670.1 hypothetical protein [Elizabethkingia anophelis]MDV3692394.1 hypothetical protein [Elizabethkingia anophelis]MDV3706652.1 hypothetical protein [Elizabethkingia anophelis]OPB50075.1 hypothetical protein BAY04_06870 [Elizabethkingia anophelis]
MENKLIPMTDFVLQEFKRWENKDTPAYQSTGKYVLGTKIYADFLKQPLALWMFVPCDGDGNPWIYPPTNEEWEWAKKDSTEAEQSFKQKEYFFKKAKERVLFEGFKVVDYWIENKYGEHLIDIDALIAFSIEDLASWHMDIELTPTAIKSIYGS